MKQFLRHFTPDIAIAVKAHFDQHRSFPNLFNPRTFSEKVCHRKIFDRRPILTQFADKYAVREYVEKRLGAESLPKLYHVTQNPSDIPFDDLPNKFVVKPTHGCSWLRVVMDKTTLDWRELIDECSGWLAQNYYDGMREWQYKDITPRIMVEEFIDSGTGIVPNDYKFFVFDGTAKLIQFNKGRYTSEHIRNLYNPDWTPAGFRFVERDVPNAPNALIDPPKNLADMIKAAETLAAGMDFVRVDLYSVRGQIYFGEMTATPASGVAGFDPPQYDLYLGQFWRLPPVLSRTPNAKPQSTTDLTPQHLEAAE